MNVFYNKEGVGDVLMVILADAPRAEITAERKGNVATIFHGEDVIGYNIFEASNQFTLDTVGPVDVTPELVETIQHVLGENGVDFESRDIDYSPKFVVGFVVSAEKHPDADKLSVCQVEVDGHTLQIVCGAPNVAAGQKVVVAKPGAVMPSGLIIRPSSLRGVASSGMLCSARELALADAPQAKGILVLDESAKTGETFLIGR
ncbi:YtpR family tRNA-binding protein [Exiguobacterium antarcticum]|uniref:DUF4479 domain-containing protein n=1 Tax=Exiguobacterium antarcticum TaxID=132920 RepID=A0ABT6QY02_9BACL|nr:DUF4479 family protein [Exiguobacterium antarcticum]AFS71200.1 T-RNA-binding domain protein [Exiguobacterium antarcticum B7]MDI3233412.1 DUF4479 domain-containing protein [Exiguobacterium antarcticum]